MNAIIALILRLILILLAYLFVGWIGYWIFYDFRNAIREKRSDGIIPISLQAQLGTELFEKRFSSSEITIGRDPNCDFSLLDDAISLRHCKLSFRQKHWWAEDLDSTNGSYLNEALIETPIILTNGDLLRIGHIKILIKFLYLPGVTNEK